MKNVLLLLSEGFEILEASAFIDVIGWNNAEGDHSTELFTCGLRKEIKSAFNQMFIVDYLIDDIDIDCFDALALPVVLKFMDITKMLTIADFWKLFVSLISRIK